MPTWTSSNRTSTALLSDLRAEDANLPANERDASLAPDLFADSARVYVRMAEENVIGKSAYIENFSVEDLPAFRAVKE